ncbi:MAG: diacylglycerol kinase [bacterium]
MRVAKRDSLFMSFNRAVKGIFYVFKTQRNMRIHLLIALVIVAISIFLNLDIKEVIILSFTIFLVLITEMFNTAVELAVNLVTDKFHPLAKTVKDITAGAVLFASINAILVGYLIFFRKMPLSSRFASSIFVKIQNSPEYITAVCLAVILLLVIGGKAYSKQRLPLRGGMPSGHTAFAFALSTACAFISKNIILGVLTLILAIMIGESRIRSGIHTKWEVFMGGLIGVIATILIFQIFG